MPSDGDLRASLSDPTPRARLHAAWALGARSISDEMRAAWGGGAAQAAAPANGGADAATARRFYPLALTACNELVALALLAELDPDRDIRAAACQFLARAATPDNGAAYGSLLQIAGHDPSEFVRAAVLSNLRGDAPAHVASALTSCMRDPSVEVMRAAVDAAFAMSPSPGAFLHRMRDESPSSIAYALSFLRQSGATVAWSDVTSPIAEGGLVVLVELAGLFAGRPGAAPTAFWLRCVKALPELMELPEPRRVLILDGVAVACKGSKLALLTDDDLELLDAALTVVAELLPAVAHESYLELKVAGILQNPRAAPARAVESTFGRLWLAMIPLSPHPELYELRPRYR
ncbi:hypothetical protein BH11MYX4_BH11MYX4_65730 [soil metagenome]